jgi:hypothetical protein
MCCAVWTWIACGKRAGVGTDSPRSRARMTASALRRSFVSSSLLRSETYSSVMVLSPSRCPSKSIPKSWAVAVTGEPTLLETEVRLIVRLCGKARFVSGVS